MPQQFDMAVVGAGIVGLAHALAVARLGQSVIVIDRDAQANGASIRNFGFVTVTGQEHGRVWRLARRSRDVWAEIAPQAGIAIEQTGLLIVARRPEARAVLEAFLRTDMSEGCDLLDIATAETMLGVAPPGGIAGALHSRVDLRVDSRLAIPALAQWLGERHGVVFRRGVAVRAVEPGRLDTSTGMIRARSILVCPGDDLATLFPDALAGLTRCKLQMMRLAPRDRVLPGAVMSDLGMVRYAGYADLNETTALRARLEAEQPEHLARGIHLIVTQGSDGTLIVGDSHHYAPTPDPFLSQEVDRLILDEFAAVLGDPPAVLDRWTGTYASAPGHSLVAAPMESVRLVVVTGGTGASTAFGLAEEVITALETPMPETMA